MRKTKILEYVNKNLTSSKVIEYEDRSKSTRVWRQLFERDSYNLILNNDNAKVGLRRIGKKTYYAMVICYNNRVAQDRLQLQSIIKDYQFEYNDIILLDDTNIDNDMATLRDIEDRERAEIEERELRNREFSAWCHDAAATYTIADDSYAREVNNDYFSFRRERYFNIGEAQIRTASPVPPRGINLNIDGL